MHNASFEIQLHNAIPLAPANKAEGRPVPRFSSPQRGEGAGRRMRGLRGTTFMASAAGLAPSSDPSGHLLPAGEKGETHRRAQGFGKQERR